MLELIEIFINNIGPIMLITAVGYWLGRYMGVPVNPLSDVVFNALSPSLVFYALYTSTVDGGEFLLLFTAMVVFQFVMVGVAWLSLRHRGASAIERANMMIAAACLNAGSYGLSLVAFAFDAEVLSRAVIVFVANMTLNYTLGVYIASHGRSSALAALRDVAKTPAVYAVILAFTFRGLSLELPLPIDRSVNQLGQAAIPMMLLVLGLQLGKSATLDRARLLFTGVWIKLLLAPALMAGLVVLLGLDGPARVALIIQAGMPTAVITIVFTNRFRLDPNLGLNLVMATTLLSPITLSVLIWILS